jgi:predicted O-linked N-acetylglucosamine transferase (SPINDLY family)
MTASPTDHVTTALKLLNSGNTPAAITALHHAIALDATQPEALHLLGIISFQSGEIDQAIDFVHRALSARPTFADAYSNLGSMLNAAARPNEAEAALRKAVSLKSDSAVYRFNLANILVAQKKLADAINEYRAAVRLQPNYPEAWSNLGIAYRDAENLAEATICFENAVDQRPNYTEAQYNLANAYRDQMRLSEAETHIRRLIDRDSGNAKAHNVLGNILSDSTRSTEALDSFTRASELAPSSLQIASNVLCCLQYVPGVTDAMLAKAHTHWVGHHNDIFTAPQHSVTDRDPTRPLKVGFVSTDLGHHPCGFLTVGLFENLNHQQIRPVIFSGRDGMREDQISRRISAVTDWRRVGSFSDTQLTDHIVDSNIDILIDMHGHTAGHRLSVFARKPAPIQMTWLGYVGSTGLPTMDYIIADRWHAPEGSTITGPEKILRLNDGYACYDASMITDEVGSLPALKNGYVTFGSLNNANKLSPQVIESFARIMNAVPDSRIILAFRGLDDHGVATRLLNVFARYGITDNRVTIHGYAPHAQFLKHYHQIDIALDTFPYSGGLTTCEALWMGVPVVTFPGVTFAGRHATSYMTNVGLSDFVASDGYTFEQLAVAKAQNIEVLSVLRQSLRQRMTASPVMDAARFATSFSDSMRQAWQLYCTTKV